MVFIFVLGLLIRLYHLGVPSLSDDELNTVVNISRSFWDSVCIVSRSSFPPLHYGLLNVWVSIFGNSEWALRLPSAVFSSLTIIVIYKIGKEFFNKTVGLLSAFLFAFSPFAIDYAQNAKMYAMYWFLTALSFLFLFRLFNDQKKGGFRAYVLTSIFSCYTMYTGFLFLAVQNMIFFLMGSRSRWGKWLTGQLIVLLACLPWMVYFLSSKHTNLSERHIGETVNYLTFFLNALLYMIGTSNNPFWDINYFLYFFLIAYSLIDIFVAFTKNRNFSMPLNQGILWMWVVFPLVLYFIFDYFIFNADIHYRYIGFLQIPLILLVSHKVNDFHGALKKALISLLVVVAINNTFSYFKDNLRHPQQDWRGAAVELNKEFKENDLVLALVSLDCFKYYYKGDMHRFFSLSGLLAGNQLFKNGFPYKEQVFKKDSPESERVLHGIWQALAGKIDLKNVNTIFFLYKMDTVPVIKLNGFYLERKADYGEIGFLRFCRK